MEIPLSADSERWLSKSPNRCAIESSPVAALAQAEIWRCWCRCRFPSGLLAPWRRTRLARLRAEAAEPAPLFGFEDRRIWPAPRGLPLQSRAAAGFVVVSSRDRMSRWKRVIIWSTLRCLAALCRCWSTRTILRCKPLSPLLPNGSTS